MGDLWEVLAGACTEYQGGKELTLKKEVNQPPDPPLKKPFEGPYAKRTDITDHGGDYE